MTATATAASASDGAASPPKAPLAASPPHPSCPPILLGIRAALGPSLLSRILSSRILLVGSGGIGCELLKNLALSGFRHVEVVDLDTIDVSNLNRQFLFRSHHVGMPKCEVATAAALAMVPPLPDAGGGAYIPHHGNVCDNSKFNVPYVRGFDLVLNALDNVAARRQVNRLCLAADTPLVEAGTAGYLGQVTVIHKSSGMECYECQTKPTQKVYPICTIRSTPSQPVHCIVWAKELYKLCFGTRFEDSMLFEDEESLRADRDAAEKEREGADRSANVAGGEAGVENSTGGVSDAAATAGGEKSTYMDAVKELRSLIGVDPANGAVSQGEGAVRDKSQKVLAALFIKEIQKQIAMDRYKTAEKVPAPISAEDIANCADGSESPALRQGGASTDIWSASDCASEMAACFAEVAANSSCANPTKPLPEFDKDDDVAMRFVTAASNLRSYVFQIEPLQSLYSAKGIAGNIIPAIATTNAIAAGLQVLQAFIVLRAKMDAKAGESSPPQDAGLGLKEKCRYTYILRDKTRRGYLLQPTAIPDPNPNCFVCRNATVSLAINTNLWTLDMLVKRVLKKELGFGEPTIVIGEDIVYEEGEDIDPSEYAANLGKRLADLPAGGAGHGAIVRVEDFTQDLEVEVSISHQDRWVVENAENDKEGGEPLEDGREEIEKFKIGGKRPAAAVASAKEDAPGADPEAAPAMAKSNDDDDSDGDILEVVEPEDLVGGNNNMRGKLPNGGDGEDEKAAEAKNLANGDKNAQGNLPEGGAMKLQSKKRPLEEKSGCVGVKKARNGDSVELIELD